MPDNSPTERPPVIDAEFEDADRETGDGGETQRDTEAIVLATQDAAARLSGLSEKLQGHVPDEVVREIQFLGNFALATARNQTDFERRLAEIRAAQEGRDRALALILVGGNLSELDIEGREKAPDKLRSLEIETPDTVELVDEKFTITLTNPNGVKVQADVSVKLQDFDGTEDPVLECVVSPRAGRSSGLTQRPIALGPNVTQQIEVAVRSKLGKEGNPKPEDIIAEKIQIDVKVSPTDPDSTLEARSFEPVQRDVAFSNAITHRDEVDLTAYGQRSGMAGDIDRFAEYPLRIEGLEFLPSLGYSSVSPVSWPTQGQRVPTTGPAYTETVELVSCPTEKQMGQTYTETFEQRGLPQVRTKKWYIPLRLSTEVTIHLADELSEIR